MQRFKIILEYLRAARDQQAFLVPTNLEGRELASLAAEAQYYGLVALHESLQAASVTKPNSMYEYKHELHYGWEDRAQKMMQNLYDEGWEPMDSNVACSFHKMGGQSLIWIALRRPKTIAPYAVTC